MQVCKKDPSEAREIVNGGLRYLDLGAASTQRFCATGSFGDEDFLASIPGVSVVDCVCASTYAMMTVTTMGDAKNAKYSECCC